MTRALCLCLLLTACAPFPEVGPAATQTALQTPGLLTTDALAAAIPAAPATTDPLAARVDALTARADALRDPQ